MCDNCTLVLNAYTMLLVWNMPSLVTVLAITFGARCASTLLLYGTMKLRCAATRARSQP